MSHAIWLVYLVVQLIVYFRLDKEVNELISLFVIGWFSLSNVPSLISYAPTVIYTTLICLFSYYFIYNLHIIPSYLILSFRVIIIFIICWFIYFFIYYPISLVSYYTRFIFYLFYLSLILYCSIITLFPNIFLFCSFIFFYTNFQTIFINYYYLLYLFICIF